MWQQLLHEVQQGNIKAIARSISLIENESKGYEALLQSIPFSDKKILGITGPPGAGKSTLTDALIGELINANKRICVFCIDPSSPFHKGALLGDRIRMSRWYNHPAVFIRSFSTRGNIGGLPPRILEITEFIKAAPFDHIIIETVGVGQSEVEIAALADTTVVVLVPEAGDEIQTMKAGLMEIAEIFVVNKADRPGADELEKNLLRTVSASPHLNEIPVIKTVATEKKGIEKLLEKITWHEQLMRSPGKKISLLAEKAFLLIQQKRMKNVSREFLKQQIQKTYTLKDFNLYKFIESF